MSTRDDEKTFIEHSTQIRHGWSALFICNEFLVSGLFFGWRFGVRCRYIWMETWAFVCAHAAHTNGIYPSD